MRGQVLLVSHQCVKLFSFRMILVERAVTGYIDARTLVNSEHCLVKDTAVAIELLRDGNGYEKSLNGAARNRSTPPMVRY